MACLCPVRKNSPPSGLTNPIEFFDMAASWPHRSLNSIRLFRIAVHCWFRAISYHSLIRVLNLQAFQSCQWYVKGGLVCLHIRIIGDTTTLRWNPRDVLVGLLDVARLAVDGVLRIYG